MATKNYTFTASSETPVIRHGWDGDYEEYLLHNEGSVDLSILNGGTARVLLNHNTDKVVGNIIRAWIENKELTVEVAFDDDLKEGAETIERIESDPPLYKGVSVGFDYRANHVIVEEDGNRHRTKVTYQMWIPREVSFTAVPADPTVGIGMRCTNIENKEQNIKDLIQEKIENQKRKNDMPQPTPTPTPTPDEIRAAAIAAAAAAAADVPTPAPEPKPANPSERNTGFKVIADNREMLRNAGMTEADAADMLTRAMSENWTEAKSSNEVLAAMKRATEAAATLPAHATPYLSEHGNQRGYSIETAIREACHGRLGSGRGSVEAEMHADAAKNSTRALFEHEYALPVEMLLQDKRFAYEVLHRTAKGDAYNPVLKRAIENSPLLQRNIAAGSSGNAGSTSAASGYAAAFIAEHSEGYLIESLYAKTGLLKDVDVYPEVLRTDLKITKEEGRHGTAWTGEIDERVDTDPPQYPRNLEFTWKQINAQFDITRKTIDQAGWIFMRVMEMLNQDIPRGINSALWNGVSSDKRPAGLFNTSGINNIPLGTNGGKLTYQIVNSMRTAINAANAQNQGPAKFYGNSQVAGFLRQLQKFDQTSVDGLLKDMMMPNMNGMAEMSAMLDGVMFCEDNFMRSNVTKGTSTNLSQFAYLIPSEILLAYFSGLVLVVDPYTVRKQGAIGVQIQQALDWQIKHSESFSLIGDVDTSI